MKARGEQIDYTVHLDEVGDTMTNRWGEEFLPDRIDAYWIKDKQDCWFIEVINVSGPGIKRTGELGKRRRNEWFDADTMGDMPTPMVSLVLDNRPPGAVIRP
jgi:hypothetical protein